MKSKFKNIISWFAVGVMILSNVFSPIVTAYDAGDASTSFVMPAHNVKLRATTNPNSYTIAFNSNGWAGSMTGLTLNYNQTWYLPGNGFNRTWYTFVGWNTNSGWTWTGYASGASVRNLATTWTVNLYAIWTGNKYKVAFDPNPGEDNINPVVWSMSTWTYTYNQTWTLPSNGFTRTWYTFVEWNTSPNWTWTSYVSGDSVYNWRTTSGAVVKLYAIWEAKTWVIYTVNHYLMNTGWINPDDPTYSYEFSGYTYELVTWKTWTYAWFTLSWSAQTWHIRWDGQLVFDYYYNRNLHEVTLDKGRWVASVSGSRSYYYSGDVSVSATLKPWYTWLNWTWDKTTSHFKMPDKDVYMEAYASDVITYNISYDVWSWKISWQKTWYNVEEWFTLVEPSRSWCDFVWWSWTDLNTPTTWVTIATWTHKNLYYEAIWTPRSDVEYTVHHYVKVAWEDEYKEQWTGIVYTWTADTGVLLSDKVSSDVAIEDCIVYTWWSLTWSTWSLPSMVTTGIIAANGSSEFYLYYTRESYDVELVAGTWINTVTPSSKTSYECGETVNINASTQPWYNFYRWEVVAPLTPTPRDPSNRRS